MENKLKDSIARKIMRFMGTLIILIVLGGIGLYINNENQKNKYESEIKNLDTKKHYALLIQQNMNGAISDSRGYMAFVLPDFLQKVEVKRLAVEDAYDHLKGMDLTAPEKDYVDYLGDAKQRFFGEMYPNQVKYAQEGNREKLISLSTEEKYTNYIDELRTQNLSFVNGLEEKSASLRDQYFNRIRKNDLYFEIYLLIISLAIAFLAVRFARDIGHPLRMLALSSNSEDGKRLENLHYDARSDEIGYLTTSLKDFVQRISFNERKLIEQNDELQAQQEELIAQQEELLAQQEELNHTLDKMQENEKILEAQFSFSNALVNTYDRSELLESILKNMLIIQKADIGAIVLIEPGYPRASVGVKSVNMDQFIHALEQDVNTGVFEDRDLFVLTREATPLEKGYHGERIYISDLYIPIFSSDKKLIAVGLITRLGREFNDDSLNQARALVNQITLSLEKLKTFEQMEHDRSINQKIIDSIREGIQLFDENGELVQVNETWHSWTKSENEEEECSSQRFFTSIRERVENADELLLFVENVLKGFGSNEERFMYRMNGDETRFIQVYTERIFDSQGVYRGTIFVHRDITKEYEIDQMKSEFVSTVSHELRTPLSSVLGFTELMLNKELKVERQKQYLQTIHKETYRLTQLINDFLDIQRMESGKQVYEKKKLHLSSLLKEIVETFKLQYPNHHFEVKEQFRNDSITGDENRLKQVFLNIIGNAVKFSPSGGDIHVLIQDKENNLHISVIDKGLGIPEAAMPNLFSKFYRIDNSDRRKIGGTGLGLAISKEIVEAHDGTITVDSVLSEGSTFTISLPTVADGITEMKEVESSPSLINGNLPRVLIVEDDDSLALMLKEELMESGFEVLISQDGEEALKLVSSFKPDAIVLDIMLNESIDGWEIIKRMQSEGITIPIFISSALDEKERGRSLGAYDYLTKPYSPSQLSKTILHTLLQNEKKGVIMVPSSECEGNEP